MFEEYLQHAIGLLKSHPAMAIGIAATVAAFFYFKPKETFKLVVFCLFIVAVFYCITLFAGTLGTGAKQKDQMIYKTKEAAGE